ncbi:hypothetical protein B0H11DRAFT_2389353 [Mycena galericulata]|nr:hypothetical protein B0H11DRAFT_2389353 [Mycena galericulata]
MSQPPDQPVQNPPQLLTQSSKYWIDDGSVTFRVENMLYKVHLSNLKKLSPVVQGIFEIPSLGSGPPQGSDENPILLEFFTPVVFEDFLAWIYRAEWQPLDNTDLVVKQRMLVNLLHVAKLWEISEAVEYAKRHLNLMYLPPSRRLELARMYSLHDWIHDAVASLVTGKLDWITEVDQNRFGAKVYTIIANAKEVLWYETRLACRVPPQLDPNPAWVSDNHDHRVCTEVFNEVWWTKIARKVLDLEKPLRFSEIAAEVKKTVFQVQRVGGWKIMADACKEDMVVKIGADGFFSEKAVIEAAARAVERYFESL